MHQGVQVTRDDAILTVTLDRPKANAIDAATSRALYAAFDGYANDDSLRVAILTAAGERFFSDGWDLHAAAAGEQGPDVDYGSGGFAGITELWHCNKPIIAAVNGMAAGGGFELALTADLVVAARHAEFFVPETGIGIIADAGGTIRLPRKVPYNVALDLMLTGRRLSAEEGRQLGFVNRVVDAGRLDEEARLLAHEIIEKAPLAITALLATLRRVHHEPVANAFSAMREQVPEYQSMLTSADAAEGPRAFAQGRKPQWSGR